MSEVMCRFVSPAPSYERAVLVYDGEIHWKIQRDQVRLFEGEERSVNLDHSKFSYCFIGAEYEFEQCDEITTFSFMELEGNWSSSDGGSGRWEL